MNLQVYICVQVGIVSDTHTHTNTHSINGALCLFMLKPASSSQHIK